jgi:hypothetical protein
MGMQDSKKEDLKRKIEENGLVCDCGQKVYDAGAGAIENQSNDNKLATGLWIRPLPGPTISLAAITTARNDQAGEKKGFVL